MVAKKPPTKAVASKAGKTLSTSKSSKAKSAAASVLAARSVATRKIHAAPKAGSVSRAIAKKAVTSTLNRRKK